MNATSVKKTSFALSLCVLTSLYAVEGPDPEATPSPQDIQHSRLSTLESRISAIKVETVKGTTGAKMASASPRVDGIGLFITGDLLFWRFMEGGTDYVIDNHSPADALPVKGKAKNIHFDWDFGFRTGIGYRFDHDDWDTYLNFTWFNTDATDSTHGTENGSLIPEVSIPVTVDATFVKTHWNVHYYVLDLELARSFFVSKSLAFRPQFGIEGAGIFQHNRSLIEYVPDQNIHSHGKNNFMGVGPRAGVAATWFFGPHLSVFGTMNGALLWGRFDVEQKDLGSSPSVNDKVEGDFQSIVPNVTTALGFGWDSNLFKDHFHVGVKISYEFQYWWRQNQTLRSFQSSPVSFERASENLTLDGLTLDVRFDF